jgi:murein DD-endopeptidase MepM/ murein hydrolase activator NlpD
VKIEPRPRRGPSEAEPPPRSSRWPRPVRGTRRLPARLVFLGLVGAVGLAPALAGAQTDGTDQQRQTLQHQIGEASAEETQALTSLQAIRDRQAQLDGRVSDLNAQLQAAQATLDPLQADVDRVTVRYQAVAAQEQATQAQLDLAQHALNLSAASQLINARAGDGYSSIQGAQPADLISGEHYLRQVSSVRRSLVEQVRTLRDTVDRQRQTVATQKAQADALAQPARAARDQIVQVTAQLGPALADAGAQQAAEQAAVRSIQSRKAEFEAQLNGLQAASDSIAALLRQRGSGPGAPAACDARPVPGPIVSGFGPRVDPVSGAQGFHPGIDLEAGTGTPIHACRSGVVVIASAQGGYGNAVVIDHGGAMATLYGHQSRLAVNVNQHVNAGDVIGYAGATGYATGPHLHFEVRLTGNPVDPASYLP